MEFSNKTVVITGAAGGIGKEVARLFAKSNANLALIDIDQEALDKVLDELNVSDEKIIAIKSDVSNEEDVINYVRLTKKKFGRIDVFFNNAGIEGVASPIYEYPTEMFDILMKINVNGVFYGLKHVLKEMVEQKSGSVINTSSIGGLKGLKSFSAYIASKHAVIGLTKSAALDVANLGIRVNAICPSPVNTRMMQSIERNFNPENSIEAKKMFEQNNPMGRYSEAYEVAELVYFLASEKSRFITGACYTIDGGASIR